MLRGRDLSRSAARWAVSAVVSLFLMSEASASTIDEAVERYRSVIVNDIDRALAGTREMRDRIAANDIPGAQKAWIDARVGWERSEVFTSGFVPQLDDEIDAWPDAVTGFHAIEVKLFGGIPLTARDETDTLIHNLAGLDAQVRTISLTPQGLMNGLARLAYEVGDSKVDGGESRFSGTSLNDMRSNVDGIDLAYRTLFAAPLQSVNAKLAEQIQKKIDQLRLRLQVSDLRRVNPDELRRDSEELVLNLQAAGPAIGLAPPSLEEATK